MSTPRSTSFQRLTHGLRARLADRAEREAWARRQRPGGADQTTAVLACARVSRSSR